MGWISTTGSENRRLWAVMGALLLAVLLPTVCLLWFMNEAVGNERLAVRQRLQQAYRGELAARQDRLEQTWLRFDAQIQATRELPAPQAFAAVVHEGASSALIFREGKLAYPALQIAPTAEETGLGRRAAERLGQGRTLMQSGHAAEGYQILGGTLQAEEFAAARDEEGRFLAPNAALLAIELLPADSPERQTLASRLAQELNQYDGRAISSPQRLFLMQQLHAVAGKNFPTMAAEGRAIALAEIAAAPEPQQTGKLRLIAGTEIWARGDGNTCVLFTQNDLIREVQAIVDSEAPQGTVIALRLPGVKQPGDVFMSVPAGDAMQDWAIDLSLRGPDPFAAAAQQRAAVYGWTAALAIGLIVLMAAGLAVYMSRQMALTRLKNDLIATVSHELKTPLASMRVLVDTLLEGRVAGPREQREYLAIIGRENARLSRLIDNFLTFSRMERRKAVFDFRPVDVAKVLREAVAALGERASGIQLDVPRDLQAYADEDALLTVVLNLLDNAVKYSDPGTPVHLSAGGSPQGVEIAVRDEGIGMARRHHRRIFQRFYQIDRALSRRAGGCGLGLAIVDHIVRGHHGSISVASAPGKGSTFRVTLPGVGEKQPAPVAPPQKMEAA